jgi:hypothetical protein
MNPSTLLEMTVNRDVVPYNLAEIDRRFRGVYCLHPQGALMMELVITSETSDNFCENTCHNIPVDGHLYAV